MVVGNEAREALESVLNALMGQLFIALHQCRGTDNVRMQNHRKLAY